MSKSESAGYNLSFAGCGFLGLYHAGVCGCIQEFAPQLYENLKISGASAGAIAATFLACNVKISDCIQYLMQTINSARAYILGPFDPRFKVTQLLREGLELYLPDDAHIICSGKLHISMTNQTTKENYIAKTFKDKNELIKAVLCSSYIPIFSGFIPLTFRGEWMIDGALTRNMLTLDGKTITVSPFSGDADICPRDDWGCGQLSIVGTSFLVNSENIRRLFNIFWPKSPEELGKLTQLGYSDALQFLARKGFIKCQLHRHNTVFIKMKVKSEYKFVDESCKKCRRNLHLALQSSLPNSILAYFKSKDRISIYNNYVTRKVMKYLKMLTNVTTMPISITITIIRRCITLIKYLPAHLIGSLVNVVRTLASLDDIFKKALSNAVESNYRHSYFCDELKNFPNQLCYLKPEFESENIYLSESEDSLIDVTESDSSGIFLPGVDDEQMKLIRKRIGNLGDVTEDIYIESCDEDYEYSNDKRLDIPGSENKENESASIRGVADGSELVCSPKSGDNSNGLFLDINHQMSWSYPDLVDPEKINYYIIAPILQSSSSNSSDDNFT